MQEDLQELDLKKADAAEDIKQQTIAMDVGAAADQEKIRAEKEIEAAKAKTAGINQTISGVIGGATMAAPLFGGKGGLDNLSTEEMQQLMGILGGGGLGSFGGK